MKPIARVLITVPAVLLIALSSCILGDIEVALTGMELSQGMMSPAFRTDVFAYVATVPEAVSEVTVTVKVVDESKLAVSINGMKVIPGTGSMTVPLASGMNDVTVTVSFRGETATYEITVARGAPDIAVSQDGTPLEPNTTVDFGMLFEGDPPKDITFGITNNGGGFLFPTAGSGAFVLIVNDTYGLFSILSPVGQPYIAPGDTREFIVRFIRDGVYFGTATADLEIATNDPDLGLFGLTLSGTTS